MDGAAQRADELRQQIAKAEAELSELREQLTQAESAQKQEGQKVGLDVGSSANGTAGWKWPLSAGEYERYGRQLILPDVGINGQKLLKSARVLIVGGGGLGCPAAAYLAGAGVGTLGIVDGDVVEASNLHRQIAHGTSRVGMSKADSLITYCRELNPLPCYIPHREHLTPQNAEDIVAAYDLVLDCTDHPTSRYLISDICVLVQKPLVSASALRTDGQLIVLNTPPTAQGVMSLDGDADVKADAGRTPTPMPVSAPPCYRCVFPRPPPPDAVVSCGEGGVLGPAVGVMGVLQALEAVKIIVAGLTTNHPPRRGEEGGGGYDHYDHDEQTAATARNRTTPTSQQQPTLLLFSGATRTIGAPTFRSVRMRARRRDCFACGEGAGARLTLEGLRSGGCVDYVAFCGRVGGGAAGGGLLGDGERISAREFGRLVNGSGDAGPSRVLLDVREKELFDVASIDGAVNVPFSLIQRSAAGRQKKQADGGQASTGARGGEISGDEKVLPEWMPPGLPADAPIYVVCRVGNDSQVVARQLIDAGLGRDGERWIGDIRGGMRAWRDDVDETLPFL